MASIAKKLQIPHFVAIWQPIQIDNFNGTDSFTRNLFPQSKMFSEAVYEIVNSLQWKKFAVVYDSDDALVRFQELFRISSSPEYFSSLGRQIFRFYRLPAIKDDYKVMLKDISKSGFNQMIVDCSIENIYTLLKESMQVGMMDEYLVCFGSYHIYVCIIYRSYTYLYDFYLLQKYFMVNYDAYTIDLSSLGNLSANITTIRLFNPENINFNEYPSQPKFYTNQLTVSDLFSSLKHFHLYIFIDNFVDGSCFD